MPGLTAFREIRGAALKRWQALRSGSRALILVGTATCGRATGALDVLQALRDQMRERGLDCPVIEVGCMGHCYAEPLVVIRKQGYPPMCYHNVTPMMAERLVDQFIVGNNPCLDAAIGSLDGKDLIPASESSRPRYEKKIILQNSGHIDPEQIDHYLANGGYEGLEKALKMAPEEIIDEVKRSGLRGRGGAGFSTGEKWDICRRAPGRSKVVVCNGDEGDPGAFMDRAILESDPHSVIEGMIIAGYAVGAQQGTIYVRAEYPLAVERVLIALRQAEKLKLVGKNILNSSFSFDLRVFPGSGAFVCGEETALIASLEGKPGIPRHRPPYPAIRGLFGKPTLVNNVKTLAYVRHILHKGAKWFSTIGTGGSSGTAVFALAGKIRNTGLVEVPMGTTLRQVIFDIGGGIPEGKRFKAVQIGGPSGGCLPESALDTPISFDSLASAGAMMGSGGMIVFDEDDCMVEMARYFLEFTQKESCGKCTFCRLGTKQMLEVLDSITRGEGKAEDIDMLHELAQDVGMGALCGLGKSAPNPVLTTLRYFRDEYEAHIAQGRCPALMCRALIAFYVIQKQCEECECAEMCVETCPVDAISVCVRRDFGYCQGEYRSVVIDQEKCVKCSGCLSICPTEIMSLIKVSPPSALPVVK
ncbi:MAG: NADH-ubiquinone oxidoreductase-F iron-sulfur binding region domain-containing protein [Thermodesulfobacteriota bacterium]